MELIEFRNIVIKLLYDYLQRPVVMINQIADKPLKEDKSEIDYPFLSYSITSSFIKDREMGTLEEKIVTSNNPKYDKDIIQILTFNAKCSFSFTAYAKKSIEAKALAQKAWDFFKHVGYFDLSRNNIIVVECTNIQSRDIFEIDTYERREGFDVIFRFIHQIDRRLETIEEYKFNRIKEE